MINFDEFWAENGKKLLVSASKKEPEDKNPQCP